MKKDSEIQAVADIRHHIAYILEQLHTLEQKAEANSKVKKDTSLEPHNLSVATLKEEKPETANKTDVFDDDIDDGLGIIF